MTRLQLNPNTWTFISDGGFVGRAAGNVLIHVGSSPTGPVESMAFQVGVALGFSKPLNGSFYAKSIDSNASIVFYEV